MNKKVSSEKFVQDIRRKTRKKYSSEEKIRICPNTFQPTISFQRRGSLDSPV